MRASPVPGRSGWSGVPARRVAGGDRGSAAGWIRQALDEHASVASFARHALELLACGAPSELVEEVLLAAFDEVRHARVGFAVAEALGGEVLSPGPLATPAAVPIRSELVALALGVWHEGCVNETIAALVASEQAARAARRDHDGVAEAVAHLAEAPPPLDGAVPSLGMLTTAERREIGAAVLEQVVLPLARRLLAGAAEA